MAYLDLLEGNILFLLVIYAYLQLIKIFGSYAMAVPLLVLSHNL